MKEFWDFESHDKIFWTWKRKESWQTMAPTENIDDFYMELYSRNIPSHDGPDKIHWGYSNLGRFNIKESIGLIIETHRLEKEEKWRKV